MLCYTTESTERSVNSQSERVPFIAILLRGRKSMTLNISLKVAAHPLAREALLWQDAAVAVNRASRLGGFQSVLFIVIAVYSLD